MTDEKFFRRQVLAGEPVTLGNVKVTPQSEVWTVRFPFGGFVWNRPLAVVVEENGRSQHLPIPDVTRMIVLAAVAVSTAVTLLAWPKK